MAFVYVLVPPSPDNQENTCRLKNNKTAASLKRRKWGLGIPIHIKMTLIFTNMPFTAITIDEYTLLVINKTITWTRASVPSWDE